jgi:hypothetical protein
LNFLSIKYASAQHQIYQFDGIRHPSSSGIDPSQITHYSEITSFATMRYTIVGTEMRSENTAKTMAEASRALTQWLATLLPVDRALDFGCGKLRHSPHLARNCASPVKSDRDLPPVNGAMEKGWSRAHRPSLPLPARRAAELVRPTQLNQIHPTGLLGPKAGLEFGEGSRVIFHGPELYRLRSLEARRHLRFVIMKIHLLFICKDKESNPCHLCVF